MVEAIDNVNLSKTAFMVNDMCTRQPHIFDAKFLTFWQRVFPKADIEHLTDQALAIFSPNEDIGVSLRKRFFSRQINDFVSKHEGQGEIVFINLGSGFSTYSFDLPPHVDCYETDIQKITEFKQEFFEKHREDLGDVNAPEFVSLNLKDHDQVAAFLSQFKDKNCVICMEGVSYYLNKEDFQSLAQIMKDNLKPNTLWTFDFWNVETSATEIYQKMIKFFHDSGIFREEYLYIEEIDIEQLYGLHLVEISHSKKEAIKMNMHTDETRFLLEHYAAVTLTDT